MTLYVVILVLAFSTATLFECNLLPVGLLAGHGTGEFVALTFMELATIVAIPFAMRLFRFKAVRRSLIAGREEAMQKWGVARILLLGVPLLANTLLYYLFMATPFGYLAIILFLSMFFIIPSLGRCVYEMPNE